jgi:cytoskeleton protein RodZ
LPQEPAVPAADANSASAGAAEPPASVETAETKPAGSQPQSARVGIRFTGPSWVEVRDRGGNVVFSGTGHPSSERTIEGQPPLSIVIGNAAGVAITYNERPLDVASLAARNIARFTLE